jgi:hypothetical protein
MEMDTTVWIVVIAAIVVVAAAVAVALVSRTSQSRRLRKRFGPEYERTVEQAGGDKHEAEEELAERVARREQLDLRPLDPGARDAYRQRWEQVQAEFVERPDAAVHDAQSLLDEVMVERGYPVGDEFDDRADLVSVDHPVVAGNYRDAHRLHTETRDAGDTPDATEKRRQALVHYRALFTDLLDGAGDGEASGDAEPADGTEDPADATEDAEAAEDVPADGNRSRRSRKVR